MSTAASQSPSKLVVSSVMSSMSEAMQYVLANELTLAEDAYASALDTADGSLGEGHPMTIRALECMARCCKMQGKMDLAVPLFERLVLIKDGQQGGSLETSMAVVYADLGECYRTLGREEDEKKMMSRSAKVMACWEEKQAEEKSAAGEGKDRDNEEDDEEEELYDDDDDDDAKGEN